MHTVIKTVLTYENNQTGQVQLRLNKRQWLLSNILIQGAVLALSLYEIDMELNLNTLGYSTYTYDQSIGSTKTKYIKLNTKTHFLFVV